MAYADDYIGAISRRFVICEESSVLVQENIKIDITVNNRKTKFMIIYHIKSSYGTAGSRKYRIRNSIQL